MKQLVLALIILLLVMAATSTSFGLCDPWINELTSGPTEVLPCPGIVQTEEWDVEWLNASGPMSVYHPHPTGSGGCSDLFSDCNGETVLNICGPVFHTPEINHIGDIQGQWDMTVDSRRFNAQTVTCPPGTYYEGIPRPIQTCF